MEDALREIRSNKFLIGEEIVLILVLMEDALRDLSNISEQVSALLS